MGLSDSTVAGVRAVPITEILSAEEIPFKRIGREAVTLCPWHADTHPSLTVNDDKNICFCFACGGGSDGIAYVQQKFGLSFSDAVIRIAEKHDIAVAYDNITPEQAARIAKTRQAALLRVVNAHKRYRAQLKEDGGEIARDWILERGLLPATSKEFELGWSKEGWLGGRIVVPIHDHRGNLVGFTGRALTAEAAEEGKYKNSANSDIFDKDAIIFNEHRAGVEARRAGYLMFVEGHFDVISLWQHGIRNVVATQGTAGPTIHTIKRLMRHTRRFVLCYDGDQGGMKAVEQFVAIAGRLACDGEITLSVVQLPAGKDPEDCIKAGIDLHSMIEEAPQWLDWQLDVWLASIDRSDTHRFSQIEKAVRSLVESIASPALRQYYVDKASKLLSSDVKAATKLAKSWVKDLPRTRLHSTWSKPTPAWTRSQVERRALRAYIHFRQHRADIRPVLDCLENPSSTWLWGRLKEIEALNPAFGPYEVMAVLAVSEPHYLRLLRPLAVPTIKLEWSEAILQHAERVLRQRLEINLETA